MIAPSKYLENTCIDNHENHLVALWITDFEAAQILRVLFSLVFWDTPKPVPPSSLSAGSLVWCFTKKMQPFWRSCSQAPPFTSIPTICILIYYRLDVCIFLSQNWDFYLLNRPILSLSLFHLVKNIVPSFLLHHQFTLSSGSFLCACQIGIISPINPCKSCLTLFLSLLCKNLSF